MMELQMWQYWLWDRIRKWGGGAVLVSMALSGAPAMAQQPLSDFLAAAAVGSTDNRVAALRAQEATAVRSASRSALLPRLSASAGYTRNQIEVAFEFPGEDGTAEQAVISAQDQLDATLRADWTLLDAAALAEIRSVDARRTAALHGADDVAVTVDLAVVAAYYRLVAARHVAEAARRGVDTAQRNLGVLDARTAAGLAAPLDRDRAVADLARAAQQRSEAELETSLAERQLVVLTGVLVEPGLVALEGLDTTSPPPLDALMARAERHPRVRQSAAQATAARRARRSAALAALPSVSVFAQERFTNAAGFGPDALWSAGVNAQWQLDGSRPAQTVERARASSRAEVQRTRARLDIETEIHDAWHRLRASEAQLGAAQAEEQARTRAADVARTNLDAGTGSTLALSVAERDRFDAEVARIRARANHRIDDLTLRLVAGLPLEGPWGAGREE